MVLSPTKTTLPIGTLRRVHHIALNVKNMEASRQFYGEILGLHELAGDEVPETLRSLVAQGKVANFITPDGTVLDLFWEPELTPANPDPTQQFTRANHLAFDIAPEFFEQAVAVLHQNQILVEENSRLDPHGVDHNPYTPIPRRPPRNQGFTHKGIICAKSMTFPLRRKILTRRNSRSKLLSGSTKNLLRTSRKYPKK